jgi:hypothetical protein
MVVSHGDAMPDRDVTEVFDGSVGTEIFRLAKH